MRLTPKEKKNLTKMFYDSADSWFDGNDYDCTLGYNLSDDDKTFYRSNFKIEVDEKILFARDTSYWNNRNQGLVITDEGFYCINDNDDSDSFFWRSWKDFDNVRYKESCFYFNLGSDNVFSLGVGLFYKDTDRNFRSVGQALANVLTKMAQSVKEDDPMELAMSGEYEQALQIVEQNLRENPNSVDDNFNKGRLLLWRELDKDTEQDEDNLNEAKDCIRKAIDLLDGDEVPWPFYKVLADVESLLGNYYAARDYYIEALGGCGYDDAQNIQKSIDLLEENPLKDMWDNWVNISYENRKFIMPIQDSNIGGCFVNNIYTFRMSNIPSCIKFPQGHPKSGVLYIGHPYNPNLYVPFEGSEEVFFVDRMNEFCHLLQSLGAEEIFIESVKGKSVSELSNSSVGVNANIGYNVFSVGGSYGNKHSSQNDMTQDNKRKWHEKYDRPKENPHVPDNLIWYAEEPQWQRLVERRIKGNLLEYNETWSSSQTSFTSSSEMEEIEASAQYLMFKANGGYKEGNDYTFKQSEETQWEVSVKFRSMRDF